MKQFVYILLLLTSVLSLKSQTVIYQDSFRGGVTGGGFSTGLGSGPGTFEIYMEPGSQIHKAFLFAFSSLDGTSGSINLNSQNYSINYENVIETFTHTNPFFSPLKLHVIEITQNFQSGIQNIEVPSMDSMPFRGVFAPYLLVLYKNDALPVMSISCIINEQDMTGLEFYPVSDLNTINTNFPVGLAMHTDRLGEPNEKSFVKINNQDVGFMTGADQNSANWGVGVMGHFYYQNQTLFGLSDDTPDTLYGPNEGDGLADIATYLSPFSTAFNFELKHSGYPNQHPTATNINLAYFLTYTSPCDTFTATLTSDTSVCAGAALQLNATGGGSAGSAPPYEWSPQIGLSCYDCPNPVFSFQHDTVINYSVRIRNNDSCSKVLPLRIWVKPKPHITNLNITKPACGSTNGQIDITGVSGAQPPYEYTLNGQPQSSGLFTGLAAGNYPLNITGANGCGLDTVITLNDTLLVNAQFTANPQEGTAPLTVEFTNQSTNATNYLWLINGETFSTENITYSFQQSGSYTAVLVAYNNTPACADTFSVDIFVYDELSVIVPNIFTANGDGVNDVFGINVNVGCTVQAFIYNRWGTEVENIAKEISGAGFIELWNGHNHTEGVYFYVIKAKPNFGEEQVLKGNVTLVR